MSAPAPAPAPPDDDFVDTCDGERVLRRAAARALADRLFYLGFLALPWLWVLNAWTFAPHARDARGPGRDARVAKRARESRALAIAAFAVVSAWAATFYFGGARVVGTRAWERWSATTRPR